MPFVLFVNKDMATNPYFSHTTNTGEQDLFDDLIIENIQMNGVDVVYIPREVIGVDEIFVEPTMSKFTKYYTIEALMMDGAQFDGEQDIMSKFDYKIEQRTSLIVAKKRWEQIMPQEFIRPREGDLIFIGDISGRDSYYGSFINTFWQINQVWFDSPDWRFGKHAAYKLAVRTYIHSAEKFETGNPNIDQVSMGDKEEPNIGINPASRQEGDQFIVNRHNPFGDF